MKTIAIGMLGAGFIGQMHSLAFGAIHRAKREPHLNARLIALADTNRLLAEEVQRRYGWEFITTDWRAAVAHPKVELFINSGPNDAHAEPTIAAAASGKHLFSEKPLARTAEEAYRIWAAAESARVKHMCAFVHRFVPALQQMRSMIAAGEIGRIRHFRSNFLIDMQHPDGSLSWRYSTAAAGGGATGDLGSHHIDQARFLIGEVKRVGAMVRSWSKDAKGLITDVNDDWFLAGAELEGGVTASFEASRVTEGHSLTGRIEVDGTKGTLRWEMERLSELNFSEPSKGTRRIMVVAPKHPYSDFWLPVGIQGSFAIGWRDCFFHQAYHMLAAVAEDAPVGPLGATLEDGYKVAEIVDAIIRSGASERVEEVTFRAAPSAVEGK
ncbi:Predicted dehydrogenase [Rhizobiales bacterium GAS191]|nr:Predicted dehydrogenase [Rhizobiales bacterium GAS191]